MKDLIIELLLNMKYSHTFWFSFYSLGFSCFFHSPLGATYVHCFSARNACVYSFRLFSPNSLDQWSGSLYGRFRAGVTLSTSELHKLCIYYLLPHLGLLQPPIWGGKKTDSVFQSQLPLAHSVWLEAGGRIKRRSVFERTVQWRPVRAFHLITSTMAATPKQ